MFTLMAARLLRLMPNQALKKPMLPFEPVKEKKDLQVETSVKTADLSFYYPLESNSTNLPVYINLHGGAFIMHDKEMDDLYCRYLANRANCVVVNVEYAKAPEYPFPQPIEQLYEVFQWIKNNAGHLNIDVEKIMIGGQSSGANLAAALCLYLEQKGEAQPLLQVLNGPMLDFVTPFSNKPEPDMLRARYPQVAHFLNLCYVPKKGQAENPLASPVYAEINDRLAPALILIAEYDAFRPEAERYAAKLKAAGVEVESTLFKDCKHSFAHLGPKHKAEEAWEKIASTLKRYIKEANHILKEREGEIV
ncbi:alpha/beta hydrolase [Saccharibacillus sp. JS10]|uniref:alpha/beta hydrolase n=1 Tax=Saccharibacillus sp. JS10 TaxID=2950552 RepID=UPI00210E4524|nr:alpha/beta hydrolase [Saccharibacillus sp. JS10]MCQ4086710.1 alpha/beta hydrolase [Saccharibacillus sp. JS10]